VRGPGKTGATCKATRMKIFYEDNLERVDDVKVLLNLAEELLLRISDEELQDTKDSLRTTLRNLRRGRTMLVAKWEVGKAT
jgi:hypothetical protein